MTWTAQTPPGDTWLGVLLQGLITAVASGLLAGLVAYLTVRWTQRGDASRARLVASQAAALVLQRETRDAMHDIDDCLLGDDPFYAVNRRAQWHEEMLIQRPVITSRPLRDRIDQYASILDEMTQRTHDVFSDPRAYTRDRNSGSQIKHEALAWAKQLAALVKPYAENLDTALAAHRADQPLPPALPEPEWPELKYA